MRTLTLKDVPDDVVRRLERLAVRDGLSLSDLAVRELSGGVRGGDTRAADNALLMGTLPHLDVHVGTILKALEAERPSG